MGRTARALIASAIVVAAGLTTTAPASAAPICALASASTAPDGRIKFDGTWLGAEEYDDTAAFANLGLGQTAVFSLKWKNVSGSTRNIRVARFDAQTTQGYSVRYFLNGVKVNQQLVEADGIRFTRIAPNKSTPKIDLLIKFKGGSSFERESIIGAYGSAEQLECDHLQALVNDRS